MSSPGHLSLNFTNETIKCLPVEEETKNFPRIVKDACFTRVQPTPVKSPNMVVHSSSALALLGLHIGDEWDGRLTEYFSGNKMLPGSDPHAHCYAGHQYSIFTGQLGDGANLYIGDVTNNDGELWQLQLKGAGPTPYARVGTDGRKVLRSSIREFLCSEAMHHLGISTTRAGTCVFTETMVQRDKNYDGNPQLERAAVVSRIAPTLLRVGSLEICKPKDPTTGKEGPSAGNVSLLRTILDFIIKCYFPKIHCMATDRDSKYLIYFEELIRRTAVMVANWQSVGFCHGVINTDNISLIGLTLDYGPFCFMETFDRDHIPNASDHWADFTYRKQPEMCKWCLERMADVLSLIISTEKLNMALDSFYGIYNEEYLMKMRRKLGLLKSLDSDIELVEQLLDVMEKTGADYTKTFQYIMNVLLDKDPASLENLITNVCASVTTMEKVYQKKPLPSESEIVRSLWALQINPSLVPAAVERSHQAIYELNSRKMVEIYAVKQGADAEKSQNDLMLWHKWIQMFRERHNDEQDPLDQRVHLMKSSNPRFILKNYVLQKAIRAAEKGEMQIVKELMNICETPFKDGYDDESLRNLIKLHDHPLREAAENTRIT